MRMGGLFTHIKRHTHTREGKTMHLSHYFIESLKISMGVPEEVGISILQISLSSGVIGKGVAFVLVDGEDRVRDVHFKTGK